MQENHNIEDFFKKRLETHEWPFQEEDWSLLEKRLETIHPSPSDIALLHTSRTIIIIIAALTASFVLGWLTSEYFQDNRIERILPVNTEQDAAPSVNIIKEPSKRDASRKSEILQYSDKITVVPSSADKEAASHFTSSDPPTITEVASEPYATANHEILPDASIPDERFMEPLPVLTTEARYLVFQKDTMPSGIQPPVFDSLTSDISATATALTNLPVRSRWAIGIILAPDYNGVRLLQGRTVTTAIGGMVSYQFASRWFASFRILYNNKKYSSDPDYYRLPEGYWINRTNGVIPNKILGSCRVIDVPLMATFHVIRRKSMSFTASAGLGSYFMLDERYRFEFRQNNPGADTQWQTEKNSRVFFGTANLALGAEFQTTPRISVVIEPYLKIPLKEIGWGNVSLYGMGLSLTMKYRL